MVNDLEPAAEVVEPRLRPFREALEQRVGHAAFLCGSGSSLGIVCPSHDHAVALGATVRLALDDCRCVAAASVEW
jgi:4-diphosphocytidyl-2C-methyl-D-erythritol kinase